MKSSKVNFLLEHPKFRAEMNKLKEIIFFFPFYHFGGAERVHIDILKVFKNERSSCFITENSDNAVFKTEFEQNTHVILYYKLKSKKYKIYLRTIAKAINKKKHPIVFGCNTLFFYELIPYLEDHVKIIDLIHAFSYELPYAPEKLSIPVAERIDARVVLGQKTKNDFVALYNENNISLQLLDKIHIIKNKVEIPENYSANENLEILKVLFIARNSFEKRPHYVIEIAKKCLEKKLNVNFTFVGDFEKKFTNLENIEIIGSIDSSDKMQEIYKNHHVLLITSFREGFPMVILEGMANGVVPISTNVGEISEVINHENKNGFLINDYNLNLYNSAEKNISNQFLNFEKEQSTIEDFLNTIITLQNNENLYHSNCCFIGFM